MLYGTWDYPSGGVREGEGLGHFPFVYFLFFLSLSFLRLGMESIHSYLTVPLCMTANGLEGGFFLFSFTFLSLVVVGAELEGEEEKEVARESDWSGLVWSIRKESLGLWLWLWLEFSYSYNCCYR